MVSEFLRTMDDHFLRMGLGDKHWCHRKQIRLPLDVDESLTSGLHIVSDRLLAFSKNLTS
jgi:hypothetical protein